MKSSVEQIRARFDKDVDRFSNLENGHSATIDSPLVLELMTRAAAAINPSATNLLDIGCGAGNYSLKLLQLLPNLNVTLLDLSLPMLNRAAQRIQPYTNGHIKTIQADIREVELDPDHFDIILAGAVFHHLRSDDEWQTVFEKCYRFLKPGGSIWISDLIEHSNPLVQVLMWERYGDYLQELGGPTYREKVFGYIEQEDTPRPLMFQLDMLHKAGFPNIEILHKNNVFAAFGAIK